MATDLYKQILFNNDGNTEGESAALTDFNNIQGIERAQLSDRMLLSMIPNLGSLTNKDPEFSAQNNAGSGFDFGPMATGRAFCLTPGQAFLRPGSATNKVQISAGTLYQLTSTTLDGTNPKLIPFTFNGTSAGEFTIAAGDGVLVAGDLGGGGGYANYRVDLLQMKLEYVTDSTSSTTRDFNDGTTRVDTSTTHYKRKRVQCTLSVKSGAYGTVNSPPTAPDPDTGYCAVGTVGVKGGYVTATALKFGIGTDATTTSATVHDQRMPFRVKAYYTDPSKAIGQLNFVPSPDPGTDACYIQVGASSLGTLWGKSHLGRVVGIGIHFEGSAPPAQAISLGKAYDNGVSVTQVFDISSLISTTKLTIKTFDQWDSLLYHASSNHLGPRYLPSPTCKIGLPLWTNGEFGPIEEKRLNPDTDTAKRIAMAFFNAPSNVGHVIFYIAEGL